VRTAELHSAKNRDGGFKNPLGALASSLCSEGGTESFRHAEENCNREESSDLQI